jgi:hypothetical protein
MDCKGVFPGCGVWESDDDLVLIRGPYQSCCLRSGIFAAFMRQHPLLRKRQPAPETFAAIPTYVIKTRPGQLRSFYSIGQASWRENHHPNPGCSAGGC